MDFLDPKKQRAYKIQLWIGYALIGIALLLGTTVLIYQAYGFSLHKGKVVQNGLIFVSSHPAPAKIYLNGKERANTNTRLVIQAGTYTMKLTRDGYRTWQRAVTVEGGMVQHFDYPFLIPTSLQTSKVNTYAANPPLATQSPDRRFLLVEQSGKLDTFDLYDIKVKTLSDIKRSTVTLPSKLLAASKAAQKLQFMEWSNDNRHVLLKHLYGKNYEYILVDTKDVSKSVNLTKQLSAPKALITLQNKAYDRYFLRNVATGALTTARLDNRPAKNFLQNVLAYKSYGDDVVLYATAQGAPAGEVNVMLHQDNKEYHLQTIKKDTDYLLDLTRYSGSWYVAAGSPKENKVYVYKDPVAALNRHDKAALTPVDVLKVTHPTYLAFSANTQFVMAEGGTNFAVYDAQYDKHYAYTMPAPLDAPQVHATWMDGDRLTYISSGKDVIFDYDSTNLQSLMSASARYLPFFSQDYKFVYSFAPQAASAKTPTGLELTATALLTPADQ